jgi:hypothetical protein
MQNPEALKLPDQLLVRYFRDGDIGLITNVETDGNKLTVRVGKRTDRWQDLGGGLGYVPDMGD